MHNSRLSDTVVENVRLPSGFDDRPSYMQDLQSNTCGLCARDICING